MKKVWFLAILAASLMGCGEDSKDTASPDKLNCEATNQVECTGACYDACEGGAARDANCQCPQKPVDKTCEEQGKVTCNGTCYDPCPDGKLRDSQCNCPESPADKTCEEQNKIECNGACYEPCADGAALDDNCQCPSGPVDQTCEEQNKIECNGACYDPCEDGAELDENCQCPAGPVDQTCEEQNKIECNGACYDPCEDGADLDENCQCPQAPVEKTCEEQNKVECKGECYDPCKEGTVLDENCKCSVEPPKPDTCEKEADCSGDTPYCVKGVCKADNSECDCDPVSSKVYTCKDYDSSKEWAEGGKAVCSELCILQRGDCKEAAVCGNGIVEEGENCDFGKNDNGNLKEMTTCSKYAPQYISGNVTCKDSCKTLDISACAGGDKQGLYYCQLMAPVKVVFGPDLSEATMNGRVAVAGVTDKTTGNDGSIEAEFVYGSNLKTMTSWKSMAATADSSFKDSAVDAYTAKMTEALFKAVDSDTVYYTFRFREKSTDEWKYCQSNNEDPNQVKGSIDFVEITSTESKANVHEIGIATSTKIIQSNVLARFTFDSHTSSEKDANAKYSSEEGTASIQGKNIQCDSKGCFANDDKDG
ncbi:MAG: hypothetical protein J6A01_09350, partial [Proteobacteria bacterium]|nr:hypothetical protein [Pseudomonadota bacterium]